MAKLNQTQRAYALKDISAGKMSSSEICKKYDISASALSYLRKMATGDTPTLLAFEEEIGAYAPERIIRLYRQEAVSASELARDYECSTQLMKAWLRKHCPVATTGGKKISVRQATGRPPRRRR